MRRALTLACLFMLSCHGDLFPVGAAEAEADNDAAQAELRWFEGTWVLVAQTIDGDEHTQEELAQLNATLVRHGNTADIYMQGKKIGTMTSHVDPTKSPPTRDSFRNEGPAKGNVSKSIYKLEGDTLTICIATFTEIRPTKFDASLGSKNSLVVWKRQKIKVAE